MKNFLLVAALALSLMGPLPAKAQATCGTQACTYTLIVAQYFVSGSVFFSLGQFAFANFDTVAHCISARDNIAGPGVSGLGIVGTCVPTASVANIH